MKNCSREYICKSREVMSSETAPGFSAIEILVVIVVASILMTMMIGYSPTTVVKSSDVVATVQGFLLQARYDSKTNSRCLQVQVDSLNKKITRQYYDLPSDCVAPLSSSVGATEELVLSDVDAIATFSPEANLIFNRLGSLSNNQKQELSFTINSQTKRFAIYPLTGQIISLQ